MTLHASEERRRRREQAVKDSIDGVMRDTRYDRFRSRPARRALVLTYGALLAALLPAYLVWGCHRGTGVTVVGIVVLALLRVAVRVVADAPPQLLDERQRALQGRAYLGAYRVVMSVFALAALVAFAVVLLSPDPESFPVLVGIDAVTGLLLTVFGLVLAAPTCVVAWEQEQEQV